MLVESPTPSTIEAPPQERIRISNASKNKISLFILSLIALSMLFYGLLAIDMGRVNLLPFFDDTVLSERLQTIEQAKGSSEFKAGLEEARHSGVWMALMSAMTSAEYTYDGSGVYDTIVYYATMSSPQKIVLAIHNTLGGICVIIGAFQFLPGLRRRAPTLHKRIGKTYVVSVYTAMALAISYLYMTPVSDIFSELSFAFGLWMMAMLTLFSITMAIYHAMRKEIAQHQAYMALNFSILLSAPLLRYDWALMGMFLPIEKDFLEGQFTVIIMLLAHCVLSGYLIFCLNRWVQKDREKANTSQLTNTLGRIILKTKDAWPLLSALVVFSLAYHYIFLLEFGDMSAGISNLPASFIHYESQVLEPLFGTRVLLILASFVTFCVGAISLQKLFSKSENSKTYHANTKLLTTVSALGLCSFGAIMCYLGNQMGMPSWEALGGGTFYMMVGCLSVLFALLQLINISLDRWDYVRECMVLGYGAALSLPLYDALMAIMPIFNATPHHIAGGHVYEVAAAASVFSFVLAFLYVIYGQATTKKFAR